MIAAFLAALTVAVALMPWMDATDPVYVRVNLTDVLLWTWIAVAGVRCLSELFAAPGKRNR